MPNLRMMCKNGHDLSLPDAKYENGYCRKCAQARQRRYKDTPKGRITRKNFELQHTYGEGVTLDLYEKLVAAQEGRCAICGEKKKLHVDHNHKTGEIRGLLCGNCNRALGMFHENIEALQQAIRYIEGR